MAINLYVPRGRARVDQHKNDPRDLALRDALDALKASDPKKAAAILGAALEGSYAPDDDSEIPPVEDMEDEGIPKALAAEIGVQAQTNPALARISLKNARARLGTTKAAYLPAAGARARIENPWLPFGGKGAA
jgi:hypothetical protein